MDFDSSQRTVLIDDFLARAGWSEATRIPLGQDASTRRYIRLVRPDAARALLMDAPRIEADPCPPDADESVRNAMGWNAQTRLAASRVDAFVLLAGHLSSQGFHPPRVLAHDTEAGLALIEDFGDSKELARQIERGLVDETEAYVAAADVLTKLHALPVPERLEANGEVWPILDFDRLALATNADLYADWLPQQAGDGALAGQARARWESERDALIEQAMAFPRTFTLCDFHAENLVGLYRLKRRKRRSGTIWTGRVNRAPNLMSVLR